MKNWQTHIKVPDWISTFTAAAKHTGASGKCGLSPTRQGVAHQHGRNWFGLLKCTISLCFYLKSLFFFFQILFKLYKKNTSHKRIFITFSEKQQQFWFGLKSPLLLWIFLIINLFGLKICAFTVKHPVTFINKHLDLTLCKTLQPISSLQASVAGQTMAQWSYITLWFLDTISDYITKSDGVVSIETSGGKQ